MRAEAARPGQAARSEWVDAAKGLGILLVVYGHVARGLVNGGVPMDRQWFATLDAAVYAFHMPLFFLLSGWFFVGSLTRRGRATSSPRGWRRCSIPTCCGRCCRAASSC